MANAKVPKVAGLRANPAIAKVTAAGFKAVTSPLRNPSSTYKATGTTPAAGASAARGSTVTIHVQLLQAGKAPAKTTTAKTTTSKATTASTGGGSGLPADTTALPAGVTTGGGVATGQSAAGDSGTVAGAATSGGAANTSASTTAPDDSTQQATANDDQTDYAAFFSSGTGPASMYDATQATSGSGGPASAADATAPGASGAPQ